MPNEKLRRQIACEAARLMYARQESDFYRAKLKAGKRICRGWVPPADLPTNEEIREELLTLGRLYEGERRQVPSVRRCSITGELLEGERLAELEGLPEAAPKTAPGRIGVAPVGLLAERQVDRFQVYETLLLPLAGVKQSPVKHPEGDALYHSLQVFDLARDELPYDEEFLLAALLHDVGKGIDGKDHLAAGLEALEGYVTERTRWLIEHHPEGHAVREGTVGARMRQRLAAHESYEELLLLAKCDREGRRKGVEAPELEEALEYLRDLAATCGE